MKRYYGILAIVSIFIFNDVLAQYDVYVDGYFKRNGTYVQPHYKTSPNASLFDNYSTKGNYNPYTGKPGWIEPYTKLSTYSLNHNSDKQEIELIIYYLNKKDSNNFYKLINAFGYDYKQFFSALFKFNQFQISEANEIFKILKDKGKNNFIVKESSYWYDITKLFLNVDAEFKDLYLTTSKFEEQNNYEAIDEKLNSIKYPLNFYDKYLIKFTIEYKRRNYLKAISAYDSLIIYSSGKEKDSLMLNYEYVLSNLTNKQNSIQAYQNNTYYYNIEKIILLLQDYLLSNKIPYYELSKDFFKLHESESIEGDTVLIRYLNDTSNLSINSKIDRLIFYTKTSGLGSRIAIISFIFFDDKSYQLYQQKLSPITIKHSSKNSIAFNFKDPENKETGTEYLIEPRLIGGLTEKETEGKISKTFPKVYRLYFYCVMNKAYQLRDFTNIFK